MSKFLSLSELDYIKGCIMAMMSAGLTAVYNLMSSGTTFDKAQLTACGLAGITAGLGYLLKNVFSNSEGIPFTSEPTPDGTTNG